MPIILTAIAITFFFTVTNPMYNSIAGTKAQVASYNQALSTSATLESERQTLTTKYNAIDPSDLAKLQILLPDNVNNIRLILEIEQLAAPYGMTLSDVKYDDTNTTTGASSTTSSTTSTVQGGNVTPSNQDYGTFALEFSVSGTYDNFLSFTKDLESNLRIVDISSISFSSDSSSSNSSGVTPKAGSPEIYTYDFKIKTYWLES